jgi:hypothetical protein
MGDSKAPLNGEGPAKATRMRLVKVAAAGGAGLLALYGVYALYQRLAARESPIIISDGGSVVIESPRVPFDEWDYYPGGQGAEQTQALSWSAPDASLRVKKVKKLGTSVERDCAQAKSCVTVVEYTDGTVIQVRTGQKDEKGMTIVSNRKYGDFLLSRDKKTLRYETPGQPGQPKVKNAYVWILPRSGAASTVNFCDQADCKIEVEYK